MAPAFGTIATAVTATVAAGVSYCAVSDVTEVWTGHNPGRDTLMGGNQQAYDQTKKLLNTAATGITMFGTAANLANAGVFDRIGAKLKGLSGKSSTQSTSAKSFPKEAFPNEGTDFVVTPKGEAISVPKGATGPVSVKNAAGKTTGFAFTGGKGGANGQVSSVRIMDPVPARGNAPAYPNGYVVYNNASKQAVSYTTGKVVSRATGHIALTK